MATVKIQFIGHDGEKFDVEGVVGEMLMEAGRNNDVPNIVADCGGACACATCHVFIAPEWVDAIGGGATPAEADMLEFREDRKETSRLSCQVELTEKLDGLVVHVPETQY